MSNELRPPVVTIMGHVDHGKTSLLDYIRKTRVAAGEAGGITQHIGAYQADYNGKKITFLDTPGHAAFSKMRSRGAGVTDIAVLVVAADDGVMPQTIESIKHIQKAGVPMIVVINKIDVPDAAPEKVKAQLTEHGVYVAGYGGDIEVVQVSAKEGTGVDDLLETLATMGELLELKADDSAPFSGVVIESSRHAARGTIATVLVQSGTLRKRAMIYAENSQSTIRTLIDATGAQVEFAGPGMPVEVTGLNEVPPVGSFVTADPQKKAEVSSKMPTLGFSSLIEDTSTKLRLILKADVAGSLEAIIGSLNTTDEIEMIATGIGDVNESDVQLAETSKALIVAFQTKATGGIKKLAERNGVRIKTFRIIYELFDELKKEVLFLTQPELAERETARATVLKIFHIRGEIILGSKVLSGVLRKGDTIHILRAENKLFDATIQSLKQGKVDVESLEEGAECGIVLHVKGPQPTVVEGDQVMSYKRINE